MSGKQKIVIIGAGSFQFGLGSVGDIINRQALEGSLISLHDINAEALDLAFEASKSAIENKNLNFDVEATTNRKDALKDATFIVNSIEVTPRFDLWDQDYEIPRKFGNKQIFGENGGPGGMFHSFRIIPPILDICEDVQKICPNALFINFSNPMSRICLAIKRKFPNLKFVGLCHEIKLAQIFLPKMLGTPLSNLEITSGGLNHFGVILGVKYLDTGKDAYPDLRNKAPELFKEMKNMFEYDLTEYIYNKYGFIPYTSDSHYGEYIHWAWEKADLEGVDQFKATYKRLTLNKGKKIKRLIEKGRGASLVKPGDESAAPIIEAIITDSNHREDSVNLPNDDVITNLPRDLVVECPAIVNKDGVNAIKLGEYPKGLAALLRIEASVQDLLVEAIIKKSKEIALQALLASPIVDSATQAENILDEMMEVQGKYFQLE